MLQEISLKPEILQNMQRIEMVESCYSYYIP